MLDKEGLKDNLVEYSSKVKDTLKALEDIPDDLSGKLYQWLRPGELRIDIPWGSYKEVRKQLGSVWVISNTDMYGRKNEVGDIYYDFLHKTTRVKLVICQDSESKLGPNCRRVQVGVKEVPIYEVVCDE